MKKLKIHAGGKTIVCEFEPGAGLHDILRGEVPDFAQPCGGNHTCGKCRVHVSGGVSEAGENEKKLLGDDYEKGIRLACFCKLTGDAEVTLGEAREAKIVAWHRMPEIEYTEEGCGFAVDIGTTTVVTRLYDRATGRVLAERMGENAQRGFGADVISRIEACKTEGIAVLSDRIAAQLEEMAAACMQESGVTGITESVVTGNSTMLHLYEGLDPAPLAVVPFTMQSAFGCYSRRTLAGAPVYLPRCIGAYVGADIVCAILTAGLTGGGVRLLVDIGTNGEMVLARAGKLLCCATAAGPAFEGAGLSCGMPAKRGAIRKVTLRNGEQVFETVQDAEPAGICGSGILDALAIALETGNMDDSGFLEEEIDLGGVVINQKDVRQIQLAKSAVCAGLITLLEEAGVPAEEVDVFSIAGGFGSSMDLDSAKAVGLFPAALRGKTDFIGNAALGGAAMILLNREIRAQSERLADAAGEIELSASAAFMDHYVDCMSFMEF